MGFATPHPVLDITELLPLLLKFENLGRKQKMKLCVRRGFHWDFTTAEDGVTYLDKYRFIYMSDRLCDKCKK